MEVEFQPAQHSDHPKYQAENSLEFLSGSEISLQIFLYLPSKTYYECVAVNMDLLPSNKLEKTILLLFMGVTFLSKGK